MEPHFFYLGSMLLIVALTILIGCQRDIESSGTTRVEFRITEASANRKEIHVKDKEKLADKTIAAEHLKQELLVYNPGFGKITLRK